MELGLYSFAEITPDAITGSTVSPAQRLRDLIEEIELADQVGLDVYGIGEHHRPDFSVSAPAMVLAAAAERTSRIRLSSAVTVLSSDDPVRVFQQFSTLDLLSGGRAEVMVGRGSFIESFPLFGYDLNDYDELFIEKLELLLKIREQERVTWSGKLRAPIGDQGVYPRPVQEPLPVWVAVGGNPGSAVRTGMLGLPMALAIIGGLVPNMLPLVEYFREGARHVGRDPQTLPLSINSHGYIADTTQQAIDESYPYYELAMKKYARERGWSQPSRHRYEAELSLKGAQVAGSPEQVIEKILYQHELFGHQRFLLQLSISTMPHEKIMRAIELYGTKVAPVVRAEVAKRSPIAPLSTAER